MRSERVQERLEALLYTADAAISADSWTLTASTGRVGPSVDPGNTGAVALLAMAVADGVAEANRHADIGPIEVTGEARSFAAAITEAAARVGSDSLAEAPCSDLMLGPGAGLFGGPTGSADWTRGILADGLNLGGIARRRGESGLRWA